ncbi:MAG: hypothetical protein ACOY46_14090 [Bacillota bacterium]
MHQGIAEFRKSPFLKKDFSAGLWLAVLFFLITILGCSPARKADNMLLTLGDVTSAFEQGGLCLRKDSIYSVPKFRCQGVLPAHFKLDNIKGDLYIYVFKSYEDREKAFPSEWSFENDLRALLGQDSKWCTFYRAKNVLIALNIQDNEAINNPDVLMDLKRINEVVFNRLNDGKQLVFKGEGRRWQSEITLKYYEHWWKDSKGIMRYDSYHTMQPLIRYKEADLERISQFRYEYKYRSGSASGFRSNVRLNKNGCIIDGGGSGGNGAILREYDVLNMTIEWDGKKDIFELRALRE